MVGMTTGTDRVSGGRLWDIGNFVRRGRMDIRKALFLLLIAPIIAGCASGSYALRPNLHSRREYVDSRPEMATEMKQAILKGEVV